MNIERINSELLRQLSSILQYDLSDPRISGMLTVMEVQTSDDLSHARVFISYFGDPAKEDQTFEALNGCTGHIRNLLKQRVKMRTVPYLRIIKDESLNKAIDLTQKIEKAMESTREHENDTDGEDNGKN